MSVINIFPNAESYQILASDIVDNKVVGLQTYEAIGKKVYVSDTNKTYTINPDYTLSLYNENISVSNAQGKVFDTFANLNNWDIIQVGTGDIIEGGGNTAGAGYQKISKCILNDDTETILLSKFKASSPSRLNVAISLSQRLMGQRFTCEFVAVDSNGNIIANIPATTPVAITSLSQSTTTLTIDTTTSHNLVAGDRISIYGNPDNRANFSECIVATTPTSTQLIVTMTEYGSVTSQTVAASSGGFLIKIDALNRADNIHGITWEGTSSSNARTIARSNGGTFIETALSSYGTSNTIATIGNAAAFCDSLRPASYYDMDYKIDSIVTRAFPADAVSVQGGVTKNVQAVPSISYDYKIRIRAKNVKNMTKPIAKITSISKSGSTTWTITTDVAHGLNALSWVQLYGMLNQTEFPNLTTSTLVNSIINSTQFTVISTTGTAVSYGGSVIALQGGTSSTTGVLGQAIQSVSRTGNLLTLVGNTTWSGIAVAETVSLHGVYTDAGISMPELEGVYKVASVSTTTLVLYNTGEDMASVNVGGSVFKRTDFRLHFLKMFNYTRLVADIDAGNGNSTDIQSSIPVAITSSATVTTTSTSAVVGQVAHDSAITGSPVRIGARALTANYTAVASGDAADLVATLVGSLITKPYAIPELDWQYQGVAITNTSDVVLKAAGSGSIRNYVTSIQYINSGATPTEIVVKDGSTVIWRGFAPASMPNLASANLSTPLRGTAATAMNFACITTGSNTYINAQGYQAP